MDLMYKKNQNFVNIIPKHAMEIGQAFRWEINKCGN